MRPLIARSSRGAKQPELESRRGSVPARMRAKLPRCANATSAAIAIANASSATDARGEQTRRRRRHRGGSRTVARPTNAVSIARPRTRRPARPRAAPARARAARRRASRRPCRRESRATAARRGPRPPPPHSRRRASRARPRDPRRRPAIARPGSQPAASQPLPTSMTTVAAAKASPWVRSAFVPPALPLPRCGCRRRETARSSSAPTTRAQQVGDQVLSPSSSKVRDSRARRRSYQPASVTRGRKTSAIMQRTLPPPSARSSGSAAVTIVPWRSRRRRRVRRQCAPGSRPTSRSAAPPSRERERQQVAGEAASSPRLPIVDRPRARLRELASTAARSRGIRDRLRADDRKALADRHQHVRVVRGRGRPARAHRRRRRGSRARAEKSASAAGGRARRAAGVGDAMAAGRARGCPCPRGIRRAPRARDKSIVRATLKTRAPRAAAIGASRRSARRDGAIIG